MKMPERIWAGQQFWYPERPESPFFEEYIRADLVPRWVPVEERLPPAGHPVAARWRQVIPVEIADLWDKVMWDGEEWRWWNNGEPVPFSVHDDDPHSWMPVPPLPGESK